MTRILPLLKSLLPMLPFVVLVGLGSANNLKKPERSKQCYMPIVAVVFCVVAGIFLAPLIDRIIVFLNNLSTMLTNLASMLTTLLGGVLAPLSETLSHWAVVVDAYIRSANVPFLAQMLANTLIALAYQFIKRVLLTSMKLICKDDAAHYEFSSGLVYRKNPEDGKRYVKPHMAQGITLMKTLYYTSIVLASAATGASMVLLREELLSSLYFPVFSIIMVGELYFFLDGERLDAENSSLSGEFEDSVKICDYTFMRQVLRRFFGDKLMADNTSVTSDLHSFKTNSELIDDLVGDDKVAVEAYGLFMQKKAAAGMEVDQNYLASGLDLLNGKSVVFNNPFYYDLIPYAFFPMNRTLLRHKKVLIVLGRHAIENDVEQWCKDGLSSVSHIPSLWSIGLLDGEQKNLDVGIVTRSAVHDLRLHENNADFFDEVEFVMLIEPSRLVATAQVGLNSLIRHCRRDGKKLVFCTADKNCDGLVDALSHILMTSLEEVSATNRHKGVSSYMCWEADEELLQHRLLPNLSRYLGVGTELSFTALKNQISRTAWYGGEAFPVLDMHWIAKQYYYDLLHYAALPTTQATFDETFSVSANMWNAAAQENSYITVEDESYNMYEVKRAFSTRATNQGFINIISSDYLLKDYMAANDGIFDADSKAIPHIVADYAHTERNVIYRLCLRLTSYPLLTEEICRELSLINVDPGENIVDSLWENICKITHGIGRRYFDKESGREVLCIQKGAKTYTFDSSVIEGQKRYSFKSGKVEMLYSIKNQDFIDAFLSDLCSAEYVAEDETDKNRFLGTELRGHIFQKYLPGQFFTFGGKYYEMLRLALDGRVIVRRAADHINGRPQYRQVRNYRISNVTDSDIMGDQRDLGGIRLTKQYADISVDTPAYWRMARYNDFKTGKKVGINGIPTRQYFAKQLLRIDFSPELVSDKKTLDTLALLINEVFRSTYAENQGLIVAVTVGEAEVPLTYSLAGDDLQSNSMYIIEDSQMDVGLLVSVERNLSRILSVICDYLEWHGEAVEKSKNPESEDKSSDYTLTDEQRMKEAELAKEEKKRKGIRGFFRKIGAALTKPFKRNKKKKTPQKDAALPKKEPLPEEQYEAEPAAQEPLETPAIEETMDAEAVIPEESTPVAEELPEEEPIPSAESEAEAEEEAEQTDDDSFADEEETAHPVLLSIAPPKRLYSLTEEPAGEEAAEETLPIEEAASGEEKGKEPDNKADDNVDSICPERKPYHERHYLLFGGEKEPENIDVCGALDLLRQLGFGKGMLEQARNGLSEAENVEKNFRPARKGSHYCDFCGVELFGSEYEILADGRERCMLCGHTAVRTEQEFKKIYADVIRNLTIFFGININAPVKIKMVSAKKLHKMLGKTFVPTGKYDGRLLGVAIYKKRDGYTILLENGAPRLSATMTMVHELTHIWQYLNWDAAKIKHMYGRKQNLEVYEGMAKWVEIQYAYLINEKPAAKREEMITRLRTDAYGTGFLKYADVYPLSTGSRLMGTTPFDSPEKPL